MLEIIKNNIFFRPGRSHVRNWQKFVLALKIWFCFREIYKLHISKQNEKHPYPFKGFISSFIANIIGFAAALLTIITALVVIYVVTGHSKLKTLVANIALQCIKTVEAAALNPNHIICESGLEKILLNINLVIVTIMAFIK